MEYKKKKQRRRGKVSRVGETMPSVLRTLGRRQSGIHPEIWSRWSDIVGPDLAKRTVLEGLRKKTLFLAVKSSAWLQELSFLKSVLIERLAEEVGPDVVTDVRLVLDPELRFCPSLNAPPSRPDIDNTLPLPPEISAAVDAVADDTLRETIRRAARANLLTH